MEIDVITPEEEPESESSAEEQNADAGSEAVETPSEENHVPYSRFKEANDRNKAEIETLRGELDVLKQRQPEIEEEEPDDWKEARDRTVKATIAKMKAAEQKVAADKSAHEKLIERGFKQIKAMGGELTADMEKTVLKRMIETGADDVFGTYLDTKAELAKATKGAQVKKEGFVPPSHKGTVADKTAFNYKEIQGKSLDDLVAEAE